MIGPKDFASLPRPASGLTMMELLVVLFLIALLGTMVVQGLGYFARNYDTVTRAQREATNEVLRQHWFTTAVRGILPYGVESRAFAGGPSSFVAMTLQPLNAEPGLPRQTRWWISDLGDAEVVTYTESGALDWPVLEVEDAGLAFQYADDANRWHARWPLAENPTQWTPTMIRLTSNRGTIWLATVDAYPVVGATDAQLR